MDASDISSPPVPTDPPGPLGLSKRAAGIGKLLTDVGEQSVELIEVIRVLQRRRSIILTCMAVVTLVSSAVIFQITPRYTSEASVMLEPRKTQVVDLQSVLSGLPADTAMVRSEVEVLKSPMLAEQVVKKLNLVSIPEFNTRLQRPSSFAPLTNGVEWVFNQVKPIFGIVKTPMPVDAEDRVPAVARLLLTRTEIMNDGRSYVLKIRVESENPQLATTIANSFSDAYLESQLEAKFDAVRRANTWLNEHLTELRGKVEATDRAVQVFKAQHNLTQTRGETVSAQQLGDLNTQLILAGADRAQKESNLHQIQDQLRTGGVSAAVQVLASPLIQNLREQETNLLTQEAQLATKYKPAHPAMINIKAQERDLQQKIEDEINKIVRGMVGELAASRAKEVSLRQSLQELQKTTGQQGEVEVQLRQLEREAESNKTLYENFLNRFKQTSTQEDIQQADARLMSPARAPTAPSYPRTTLLIALSFGGSIWIGILAAFVAERLDHGFRTSDQFERVAHVPTLGLVPDDTRSGMPPIDVIVNQPISPYSESIRTIRTALRYSDVDNPPKVVMVTSSLPAEGKTVFSLSLARSVARSGGRSLIIDCDLRRPSMAKLLDIKPEPGLLGLFEDGADINSVLCVDEVSGMHFIPTTAGTPNPQDLLGSKHMATLIEGLRSQYDMIVLDTPPVLAVSDALILSHLVDTTLFLVRWGKTPRPVVLGALKSFRTNGGNLAGAVLTRVDFRRHATYGYGDSGYYYGHYGKHYADYGKSVTKAGV
jgi:capsular exopolysaccharide synthesis family protein